MNNWENIFKEKGLVFLKPREDMKAVLKLLKKEKARNVLDLGSGIGRHTVMLAKAGFKVYATDISKTGIKSTKEWLKSLKLKATIKKVSCYKKFPFKDNFFDAVISTGVIHHNFRDKIKFCVSEIERVLKPDGIIFIVVAATKDNAMAEKFKIPEKNTFIPLDGMEKGMPHFIYNKALFKKDFNNFKILKIYKERKKHYCLLGKLIYPVK